MARPMKALLEQFALVKNVKIGEMERKQWGVGGKKAMSEFIDYQKRQIRALSLKNKAKEFDKLMENSDGEIYLNIEDKLAMQKRVDETVKYISDIKFKPKKQASNFNALRKEWEEMIDLGRSFSHLSEQYPVQKKYRQYLTSLRQKEKDRKRKEQVREERLQQLRAQGITDDKVIEKELDFVEYQEIQEQKRLQKKRLGEKENKIQSLHMSQISDISDDLMEQGEIGDVQQRVVGPQDFVGIETHFEVESHVKRRERIDMARERLRIKKLLRKKGFDATSIVMTHGVKYLEDFLGPDYQTQVSQKPDQPSFFNVLSSGNQIQTNQQESSFSDEQSPHQNQNKANRTFQLLAKEGQNKRTIDDQVELSELSQLEKFNQTTAIIPSTEYAFQDGVGIFEKRLQHAQTHAIEKQALNFTSESQNLKQSPKALQVDNSFLQSSHADYQKIVKNIHPTRDLKHLYQSRDFSIKNPNFNEESGKISDYNGRNFEISNKITNPSQYDQVVSLTNNSLDGKIYDESINQAQINKIPLQLFNASADLIKLQSQQNSQEQIRLRPVTTGGQINRKLGRYQQQRHTSGKIVGEFQAIQANTQITNEWRKGQSLEGIQEYSDGLNKTKQGLKKDFDSNFFSAAVGQTTSAGITGSQITSQNKLNSTIVGKSADSGTVDLIKKGVRTLLEQKIKENKFKTDNKAATTGQQQLLPQIQQRPTSSASPMSRDSRNGGYQSGNDDLLRKDNIWKEIYRVRRTLGFLSNNPQLQMRREDTLRLHKLIRIKRKRTIHSAKPKQFYTQPAQTGTNFNLQGNLIMPDPIKPEQNIDNKDQSLIKQSANPILDEHAIKFGCFSAKDHIQTFGLTEAPKLSVSSPKKKEKEKQRNMSAKNQVRPKYMDAFKPPKVRPTLSNKEEVINYMHETAKDFELNLQGFDEETYPIYKATNVHQLEQRVRVVKDYDQQNKSYITLLEQINKNRLRGLPLAQSAHLAKLRELKKIDSEGPHRQLRAFENQVRLLENQERNRIGMNQTLMLGVVPPQQEMNLDGKELNALSDSTEEEKFNVDYGRNVRTSLPCQRKPRMINTALMYKNYREKLYDEQSMQIFDKNISKPTSAVENQFSRQSIWNNTLNCSYYGLIALRKTAESDINCPYKDENMLRDFTLGNQRQRENIRNLKQAVLLKNMSMKTDQEVYKLIEKCNQSMEIPWRHILDDLDEFQEIPKTEKSMHTQKDNIPNRLQGFQTQKQKQIDDIPS